MSGSPILNPVQPCPWLSSAPREFCSKMKSAIPLPVDEFKSEKIENEDNPNGVNSDIGNTNGNNPNGGNPNGGNSCGSSPCGLNAAMFRDLNRNTLIMSFPEIEPAEIEEALRLSGNDLSLAIHHLNMRNQNLRYQNYVNQRYGPYQYHNRKERLIPTKYQDVLIVENAPAEEGNPMHPMEVNRNVLQMCCQTPMLPNCPTPILQNCQTPMLQNFQAPMLQNYQAPMPQNFQAPMLQNCQASMQQNYQTPMRIPFVIPHHVQPHHFPTLPPLPPLPPLPTPIPSPQDVNLQLPPSTSIPLTVALPSPSVNSSEVSPLTTPSHSDGSDGLKEQTGLPQPSPERQNVGRIGVVIKKSKTGFVVRLLH